MNTHVKKPCNQCPFRKDTLKGWIGEQRMENILKEDTFVCHKTVLNETEDKSKRKQCAGFMLLKGEDSAYVQLAGRLGIDLELKGRELVFDSQQDCIDHHRNP